jgi:hypothetical protein
VTPAASGVRYLGEMSGWLESSWLRVAAYSVAAGAALVAGLRERERARVEVGVWPTFWFLTAGLFVIVAVGRAADLGQWVTQLGRGEAVSHGWYHHRRKVQVALVGAIGATCLVTVVVAMFRLPARRRRYLPAAVVVFTLMCFEGVRLVSLHQIDALLYRRHIGGVEVGTILELIGVSIAVAITFWQPRPDSAIHPARTSPPLEPAKPHDPARTGS